MTVSKRYKQAVSDYKYLKEECGMEDANDFCGGFCNTENYQELLLDVSKAKALEQLESLMYYWLDVGVSDGSYVGNGTNAIHVESDRFYQIRKRYGNIHEN